MELDRDFLIDWIDKPPSNTDYRIIDYILKLQNMREEILEYLKEQLFIQGYTDLDVGNDFIDIQPKIILDILDKVK